MGSNKKNHILACATIKLITLNVNCGWITPYFKNLLTAVSISAMLSQWKSDSKRLCAMEPCLQKVRILLTMRLDPRAQGPVVQN